MKYSYHLFLFITLFSTVQTKAQVVFNNDAVSTSSSLISTVTTLSNFNAQAGNNRLVVVDVSTLNFSNETQIVSVTYNGQNLQKANGALNYNQGGVVSHSEVWILTIGSGSAITGDIVVTTNSIPIYVYVNAATYKNVNQTYPVGNSAGAVVVGRTTNTLNISTSPNDAVIDHVFTGSLSATKGANQTQTFNIPNVNKIAGSFVLATGTSVDMSWSNLSAGGVHMATRLNHAAVALPVQLNYFDAFPKQQAVLLEWETATETDNDFFTIERSTNGTDFEAIGEVQGAGTSLEASNYSYEDNQLPNHQTQLYYRLKQTDFDGLFEYSDIEEVTLLKDNSSTIEVYPNPTSNGIFNITIENENASILIHDSAGQFIQSYQPTSNIVKINLSDLPNGIYYATITINDLQTVKKLVKQ